MRSLVRWCSFQRRSSLLASSEQFELVTSSLVRICYKVSVGHRRFHFPSVQLLLHLYIARTHHLIHDLCEPSLDNIPVLRIGTYVNRAGWVNYDYEVFRATKEM